MLLFRDKGLVVTLHTLQTTDIFHRYAIHLATVDIVVEFLVDAVELVTSTVGAVEEVHLAFTVTVNTPTHTEICKLVNLSHFLYVAVAGLALLLSNLYVLTMIKVHMIW